MRVLVLVLVRARAFLYKNMVRDVQEAARTLCMLPSGACSRTHSHYFMHTYNLLSMNRHASVALLTASPLVLQIYALIQPKECLNMTWTKADLKHSHSPNIMKSIARFNQVCINHKLTYS